MAKYRKKPIVIESVQFLGTNYDIICEFIGFKLGSWYTSDTNDFCVGIPTLEGIMTATKGDFIIKGIQGEFYPCKPDIFEKTYEKVED